MSNILFDLSGKIDQQTVAVLSAVKKVADSLAIPFFIVGASARDIILNHCYGLKTPRMTKDIDLGVEVADWGQFNQLSESLLSTGKFSPTPGRHRLQFDSVLIDIVPFGAISDERRQISWPPEHEIIMSLEEEGFDTRYASIRLLGRDMAMMADPFTQGAINSILEAETGQDSQYKLAIDMIKGSSNMGGEFDEILSLVEKLRQGFIEASARS